MRDVIDFLEQIGQNALLRNAPETVHEQALRDSQISPQLHAALVRGDRAEIESILGINNNVCCLVYSPAPDADEKEAGEIRRHEAA